MRSFHTIHKCLCCKIRTFCYPGEVIEPVFIPTYSINRECILSVHEYRVNHNCFYRLFLHLLLVQVLLLHSKNDNFWDTHPKQKKKVIIYNSSMNVAVCIMIELWHGITKQAFQMYISKNVYGWYATNKLKTQRLFPRSGYWTYNFSVAVIRKHIYYAIVEKRVQILSLKSLYFC